jgi:hypothetical protein
MKKDTIYHILVIFIIYLVFKKTVDIFIDYEYPRYTPRPTDGFWSGAIYFRKMLSFITMIFCIVLLVLLHSVTNNNYISVVIWAYLLYDIAYILCDEEYIWYIINKTPHAEKIVIFIDKYLNSSINLFLGLYCFYALVYIFYR